MEMELGKVTALDLTPGIGGRVLVLTKEGINVKCLEDIDKEDINYCQRIVGTDNIINKSILDVQDNDLPDTDIIMADISMNSFYINDKSDRRTENNIMISNIILKKAPIMILLKVPSSALKKDITGYIDYSVLRRYYFHYNVFKESEYSNLPISGNQIYMIGIRNDIKEPFNFQYVHLITSEPEAYIEAPDDVGEWYRNIKIPENFDLSLLNIEESPYYTIQKNTIQKTDVIYMNPFRETYLLDKLGLRKFTHCEYGAMKGYPIEFFQYISNKARMYRKIYKAPNIYILTEIIHSIKDFFGKVSIEIKKPQIDSYENNITKKETKKQKTKIKTPENRIIFPKIKLTNIHIDELKGLKQLDITIEKNLTAIMGVNGSGKSTILHALACTFSPNSDIKDYKFNFFFTPTPDAMWKNSKLSIFYFDENSQKKVKREYRKDKDRWSPKYSTRPKRDVYYIGIDSCLPEIEKEKQTTFINYNTNELNNKISEKIIKFASEILNKDYQSLTMHKTKRKEFIGVHTISDITYSSLSMGAGEQRLLKILNLVCSVNTYSLILIDEIDLLLHVSALKNLIKTLSEIAISRNLQIIFTTHSLVMSELTDYVDIRYIKKLEQKTVVYDSITPDIVYQLSDLVDKPLKVFVEDDLARTIVTHIAKELNIIKNTEIKCFGSIQNAFVLASSFVLEERNTDNILIVTDGDKYVTNEDKEQQLNKVLTGTEADHDEKIYQALSVISQFTLPSDLSPEEYIHKMLISMHDKSEITICAEEINSVSEKHEWIDKIVERMDISREIALYQIIEHISEHSDWETYVHNVRSWMIKKREELHL